MKSFVAYPFEFDTLLFPQQSGKPSGKLVAHYELFKKVKHLNGAIIKCGITAEEGFTRFARFREIMGTQGTQKMIAFQKFQPFFEQEINEDGEVTLKVKTKNAAVSVDHIQKTLIEKGQSHNVDFVPGGVCDSIPEYLIENAELKVAMLNIDLDDYEATMTALEFLYPRLVQGGILILDNYHKQMGEKKAVDDYFANIGPKVNAFSVNNGPHYIVKP